MSTGILDSRKQIHARATLGNDRYLDTRFAEGLHEDVTGLGFGRLGAGKTARRECCAYKSSSLHRISFVSKEISGQRAMRNIKLSPDTDPVVREAQMRRHLNRGHV